MSAAEKRSDRVVLQGEAAGLSNNQSKNIKP
jgi:hypothetical protein